jgi:molybdate transport system ATP-binding protein
MLDLHVQKRYDRFEVDAAFVSLKDGVTALFGSSGAGKTSIINMVAGLVRPDAGHVIVNGRTLFNAGSGLDVPPEKRRIGYIFQDGRLFPHLSVRTNLTYGMHLTPAKARYVAFDQVVELLGIEHLLDRRPATLSGGEKQRVAIGRALLTSPSVLLMDEPLASLDLARKAEVLPFIGRLALEFSIPILYVSHSLNEVLNLADTIVVLDAGHVVAHGEIDDLMSRISLQHLTGVSDYGAIISTVVENHDRNLTLLRFPGGLLRVPRLELPEGSKIRVRIRARNVAIALERPGQTSFQNILPARVEEISQGNGSLVDVRLNIGCMLLARITPAAKQSLDLKPGQQVFALIKSVAVSTGNLVSEDQ